VFRLLAILVDRPRELVSRDSLRAQLWPGDVYVDFEHGLNTTVKRLRQVLCDSAEEPRFIETLPRRGYRFVAPLRPARQNAGSAAPPLFGRVEELRQLEACLRSALAGLRQVSFVTGEAGIGKTALVERFVRDAAGEESLWVGWGQCVEGYGAGEPYRPV